MATCSKDVTWKSAQHFAHSFLVQTAVPDSVSLGIHVVAAYSNITKSFLLLIILPCHIKI